MFQGIIQSNPGNITCIISKTQQSAFATVICISRITANWIIARSAKIPVLGFYEKEDRNKVITFCIIFSICFDYLNTYLIYYRTWYRQSRDQLYRLSRRSSTNRSFDSPTMFYLDHILSVSPILQSTIIVIQAC